LSRERIFSRKIDNRFRGNNHDLALEWQPLCDRGAKIRLAHTRAHHKRADRADVHDIELRQLFRDRCRATSIRSTDIYRAKKNHPAHRTKVTNSR
jgi:hypothetical protein